MIHVVDDKMQHQQQQQDKNRVLGARPNHTQIIIPRPRSQPLTLIPIKGVSMPAEWGLMRIFQTHSP